jgi:outer membrane protein assembly factor BamB
MRWILAAAAARGGHTMAEKLAGELLDAASGQKTGVEVSKEPVRAGLAYADGAIYVVTDKGYLHALDASTLAAKWPAFNAKSGILAEPSVSANAVYVCTLKGELYAVDKASGTQKWTFTK